MKYGTPTASCETLLTAAAVWLAACVRVFCALWQSSEEYQSMRPGTLCSACVGILWVCEWCGHTAKSPEYRYLVGRLHPQQL